MSNLSKIIPLHELTSAGGILAGGCYDGIHLGHLRYFRWARGLKDGCLLIVCLTADKHFSQHKGPGRPAFNQWDRAEWLSYIHIIDFIAIVDEPTMVLAINTIRPKIYAKGHESEGVIQEERAATESHGGIVRIAKEGENGQTFSLGKILSGEYLRSRIAATRSRGIGEGDVGVE